MCGDCMSPHHPKVFRCWGHVLLTRVMRLPFARVLFLSGRLRFVVNVVKVAAEIRIASV